MNIFLKINHQPMRYRALIIILIMILISVSMASAHGPKGHGENKLTALQAAKKGIELYDKLVESGKIEEFWETDLKSIEVLPLQKGDKQELVVRFTRNKGEPQSLYIFFTEKGEYSGSNFTGK